MRDYLKEAEQNIVKAARAHDEALVFVHALSDFGNTYCKDHIGKKDFFEGLSLIRRALCDELSDEMSKAFMFSGIGGEEVNTYAKEKFNEWFDEKNHYSVMQFLTSTGRSPGWWKGEDEDEFRRQAKEKIDDINDKES